MSTYEIVFIAVTAVACDRQIGISSHQSGGSNRRKILFNGSWAAKPARFRHSQYLLSLIVEVIQ